MARTPACAAPSSVVYVPNPGPRRRPVYELTATSSPVPQFAARPFSASSTKYAIPAHRQSCERAEVGASDGAGGQQHAPTSHAQVKLTLPIGRIYTLISIVLINLL